MKGLIIYFCFSISYLLVSCKQANKIKTATPITNNKEFLSGTWQNTRSSNPDFTIAGDSIVFLQEDGLTKYKYEINGDSLRFYFPTYQYAFRLFSYNGDSIQLINEINSNTFKKVK